MHLNCLYSGHRRKLDKRVYKRSFMLCQYNADKVQHILNHFNQMQVGHELCEIERIKTKIQQEWNVEEEPWTSFIYNLDELKENKHQAEMKLLYLGFDTNYPGFIFGSCTYGLIPTYSLSLFSGQTRGG